MKAKIPLVIGDVVFSVIAVWLGHLLLGLNMDDRYDLVQIVPVSGFFVFTSYLAELYGMERFIDRRERFIRISLNMALSLFLLSAFYYLVPHAMLERGLLLITVVVFGLTQFLWHIGYISFSSAPALSQRVLVLGTGSLARKVGEAIASMNSRHTLVGYIIMDRTPPEVPAHLILGKSSDLCHIARERKVQRLVASLTERRGVFPLQDVLRCKFSGINVIDAPSFYEEVTGKLLIENITPSWFIFSNDLNLTQPRRALKRLLDIVFSLVGMILAAPLVPFIVLAIKLDSKGTVLFRQVRMGERGKSFVLYKFRTMRDDAESATGAVWAQENDPRVTRVGRFLRNSRLDEIPQLINILKGDMSLIGPRPERPEFIEGLSKIIPFYSERHSVKPGLTGWAQIRYPYGASVEDAIEKLRYDLFYIKNMSLFFDIGIIFETMKVILFGRGAR